MAVGPLPRGYRCVALAGAPAECLPEDARAEIVRLPDAAEWRKRLPDLEQMRAAYRGLMRVTRRPAWCQSLFQLSRLTAEESGLDGLAAAVSILAMMDMGLFEIDLAARPIAVRRREVSRAAPEDSRVWNTVQGWRK